MSYQYEDDLLHTLEELCKEHATLHTRLRQCHQDLATRDTLLFLHPNKMLVNTRTSGGGGERGGPALLSTLKVRVSRLEAALRDKEAELARLQASTKATTVNELRIQAHTYYQEVVRLRNQLNISHHHATVPILQRNNSVTAGTVDVSSSKYQSLKLSSLKPPSNSSTGSKIFHKRPEITNNKLLSSTTMEEQECNAKRDQDSSEEDLLMTSSTTSAKLGEEDEDELRKSVMLLHDENGALREQLTTLINTLQNSSEQGAGGRSKDALERVLEKLEESSTGDNASQYLQCRVSELRSKETEWERERSSLRELISTLQEDRSYYKDTATQKEADVGVMVTVRAVLMHRHIALFRSEMEALRTEVLTLQQEMDVIRDLEERKQTRSRGTRHTPRTGSSSDNSSGHSRTQSTARNVSSRTATTTSNSRTTATPSLNNGRRPTGASNRFVKASSEPRERSLPPKHSNVPSNLSRPSKIMSTSVTNGSSATISASRKQQQMATMSRLAGTAATSTTTASVRSTAGGGRSGSSSASSVTRSSSVRVTTAIATPSKVNGNRSVTSNSRQSKPSTLGSGNRSSSTAPSRSTQRSAYSSSSGHTSSSASSSKTSSQRATPLPSPTKKRSSITSESKVSTIRRTQSTTASDSKYNSSAAPRVSSSKSSSSSASSSRVSSKASSLQSSPSKSSPASYSKMPVPTLRKNLKKTPATEISTDRVSESSTVASLRPSAITEEDCHVLAELLRPEPHDSGSDGSGGGASSSTTASLLPRQNTVTLHWDSAPPTPGSDDSSWGLRQRTRGVGHHTPSSPKSTPPSPSAEGLTHTPAGGKVAKEQETNKNAERATTTELVATAPPIEAIATPTRTVVAPTEGMATPTKTMETRTKALSSSLSLELPADAKESAVPTQTKIVESLDELKSLLCSHLHRQQRLDSLLDEQPLLLDTAPLLQSSSTVHKRRSGRSVRHHRRSPDGAEGIQGVQEAPLSGGDSVPSSPSPSHHNKLITTLTPPPSKIPATAAAALAPQIRSSKIKQPVSRIPSDQYQLSSPTKQVQPSSPSKQVQSSSLSKQVQSSSPTKQVHPSSPNKSAPLSPSPKKASDMKTSTDGAGSPVLVRQGTFSLEENEAFIDKSMMGEAGEGDTLGDDGWQVDEVMGEGGVSLAATLSAHLARVDRVKHLKGE